VVAVAPAETQAEPGAQFTVDYTVNAAPSPPGIGGYVLAVSFDPAVLELLSISDAGFVTGGEIIVLCSPANIDNDAGIGVLACVPVPLFGAPGVEATTPTVFATSQFRAKQVGTSVLSLDGTYLQDPNGVRLDPSLIGGTVVVSAPQAPGEPTLTATSPAEAPSPTVAPEPAAPTVTAASTDGTAGTLSNVTGPTVGSGPGAVRPVLSAAYAAAAAGAGLIATGLTTAARRRRK
jgi:hypothetical protein